MSESKHRGRSRAHKDHQLCRQVADAITWFLADVDDPLLADLTVLIATPAPTAARVMVTLVGGDDVDVATAHAALGNYVDELREEVAAEIHRRHVPALAFRVTRRSDHDTV